MSTRDEQVDVLRRFLAMVVVVTAACGGDSNAPSDDGPGLDAFALDLAAEGDEGETQPGEVADAVPADADATQAVLPSMCVQAQPWLPGVPAFRDATEDWGLEALGVTGVLVNVIDLNGDRWPDLIIHHEGGADDFAPDGGRTTWLLRNDGLGGFEDLTQASGLRTRRGDGGGPGSPTAGRDGQMIAAADVDNDGDIDVFTGVRRESVGPDTDAAELMLSDGSGSFTLGPETSEARRDGLRAFPFSLSFTDYDRDGFVDLWVVNNTPVAELGSSEVQQDRLYRGLGDGSFDDVTTQVGLTTSTWFSLAELDAARGHSWGWSATACDSNDDGTPELLAAAYGRTPNHLWQGAAQPDGAVIYSNQSVASGYAYDDGQDWTDDLSARCWCLENPGAEDCELTEAPEVAVCDGFKAALGGYRWDHNVSRSAAFLGGVSASTECVDVDNDGHLDLLTGEIVHPDVGSAADRAGLLVNSGEADVRLDRMDNDAIGLGRPFLAQGLDEGVMYNTTFDFDNDGWQDVYWSVSGYPMNEGLLYRQNAPAEGPLPAGADPAFTQVGASDAWQHWHSHGVQAVDLDRDGDLDVVVGALDSYCGVEWGGNPCWDPPTTRIYENLVGSAQNWVQLRLQGGAGSNRAAIGARVSVTAGGVTRTQEVDGGHGRHATQRDMTLHFGLGAACEAEISIRWPDRELTTQSFVVGAGYLYDVTQGAEPVANLE